MLWKQKWHYNHWDNIDSAFKFNDKLGKLRKLFMKSFGEFYFES